MSNDVHLKYVNYVIYLRNYVTVPKMVRYNFVIIIIYSTKLGINRGEYNFLQKI